MVNPETLAMGVTFHTISRPFLFSFFFPVPFLTTPLYVFLSVPSLLSCTAKRSSEIQLRGKSIFGKIWSPEEAL